MRIRPFRAILIAQARYTAPVLALVTLVVATLPLLTLQGVEGDWAAWEGRTGLLLRQSAYFALFYPSIALGVGGFFAAANWLPDVRWRWVYALTLPVDRVRLALDRLGAGAVLLLPPVVALWLVGTIGAQVATLPAVVQSHPGALALRFGAAALVSYAATSLLVLLGRKSWYLLAGLVLLFLLEGFGLDLWSGVIDALFLSPWSPFHTLAGQWLYLDV